MSDIEREGGREGGGGRYNTFTMLLEDSLHLTFSSLPPPSLPRAAFLPCTQTLSVNTCTGVVSPREGGGGKGGTEGREREAEGRKTLQLLHAHPRLLPFPPSLFPSLSLPALPPYERWCFHHHQGDLASCLLRLVRRQSTSS